MNSTFQCVVLLAGVVACTSLVSKQCLCLTTRDRENRRLIVDIKERPPRPYCSRYEVIAVLRSGRSSCLNPRSDFTRDIVRSFRKMKEEAMRRVKLNGRETTTTVSTKTPSTTPSTNPSRTQSMTPSTTPPVV